MTWDMIERKWDEMARRVQTQWTLTPPHLTPQAGAAPAVTGLPEVATDAIADTEVTVFTPAQMR